MPQVRKRVKGSARPRPELRPPCWRRCGRPPQGGSPSQSLCTITGQAEHSFQGMGAEAAGWTLTGVRGAEPTHPTPERLQLVLGPLRSACSRQGTLMSPVRPRQLCSRNEMTRKPWSWKEKLLPPQHPWAPSTGQFNTVYATKEKGGTAPVCYCTAVGEGDLELKGDTLITDAPHIPLLLLFPKNKRSLITGTGRRPATRQTPVCAV